MNQIIAAMPDAPDSIVRSAAFVFREMRRAGPLRVLDGWRARWHYRRELRRLLAVAPHMITDIGLTLDQAQREMVMPFWRPSP
jgi:uncharacterized protein YjiS (DUF1127 family)